MQLKVMLVDDEPFILQGLSMLINWEKEGCVIVKTAANGMEAYEYLKAHQVDLVLADIKMPVMTGLELLKRIRNEKISNAYFALLSGYADFSYAQEAIRYSCIDYILKPVAKDSLLELIQKVAGQKELNDKEETKRRKMQRIYLIRNLEALLRGNAESEVLEYVEENLPFSTGVRYVRISLDGIGSLEELADDELRELRNCMFENCRQFLGNEKDYCIKDVFGDEDEYEISFLYCREMAERRNLTMEEFMERMLLYTKQNLGVPVTFLVGKEVEEVARISNSYSSTCVLKSFKGFRPEKSIYYYEDEVQVNQNKVVLCKQSLDKLIQAVERNDRGEINSSVDELFAEMEKMGLTADTVSMNIHYLLFQLIHLAVQQDESIDQEEVMLYISDNVFESGISRGSRAHFRRFACEYAEYLVQLRKNVSRGVLLDVEREIKEHFAENLTLKDLGRKYFVNSSYLGQIFRKKYGQSFKDYLSNYRINEAAQMLIKTDKKVSMIAEEVGYHDTDYFVSKFLEQKGCTPARYRKNAGNVGDLSDEN